MTSPILASTYNYENASKRWKNSQNGQYVSASAVEAEMFRHSDATHSTLEQLTRQLYGGQINLSQWQIAVASELKDAHLAQAMFAVGGRKNTGFEEFGRVGQTLREQYGFLNRFAAEIANGTVSQGQALTRIKMYGNAATQSYWAEYIEKSDGLLDWVLGSEKSCPRCPIIAAGSPYTKASLPAIPCDGSTPCLTNCKCSIRRH